MWHKLLNLFRPRKLEAEIQEELEFHRSQTNGRFGNLMLIQDQTRDASTITWLEALVQDIRYGFRQLVKTPLLLTVAVLSLALGIGANTAIFTLINTVLRQSLPVREPDRLVLFNDDNSTGVSTGDQLQSQEFSFPFWQYLRAHNDSLESLCAFKQGSDRVLLHVAGTAENGPKEQARVHLVSGEYFGVLGVQPALGRVVQPADDQLTASRVAVLSNRFWKTRFAADNKVIGKTVVLNGTAFTIVGVAAGEFFGERVEAAPDFWLPLCWQAEVLQRESWLDSHSTYWLNMMGRLKPGGTLKATESAVTFRLHQFYLEQAGANPSPSAKRQIEGVQVLLKEGGRGISGLRLRYSEPLHVLMAAVALVLLIACANIATLLLARASTRRREFLARMSLGATRGRLIRQVLTESLLLSAIGGLVAMGFAWWSVKLLTTQLGVAPFVKARPDGTVLAFTLAISLISGILFGVLPALACSRVEGPGGTGLKVSKMPRSKSAPALIVLQVALSLTLLLGAGLLAHSLLDLQWQDPGFKRQSILLVSTDPRLAGYQPNELPALYREFDDRLNSIPGVISAGLARYTPISGTASSSNFSLQGYSPPPEQRLNLYDVQVGPRFFETLGIPVLLGRSIDLRDTGDTSPVVVVNQTLASQYLKDGNPLGRRIALGAPFKGPGAEIVGVVADTKYFDLRDAAKPMAFFAASQTPGSARYAGELVIRTQGNPALVESAVRNALKGISSRLPVLRVQTLDHQLNESLDQQKLITTLSSIFGIMALLLTSIGIYGTMAYAVARRTGEIGIRMAIGAQRGNVLWMILRDAVFLISVGLVLGLPLGLAATRWIKSFLFGVGASDPYTLVGAVGGIALLALLAGYLPARRATKIDPLVALRYE